jgi:hypothetical protein
MASSVLGIDATWRTYLFYRSVTIWGSSVSILSERKVDDWGSISGKDKALFCYPLCPGPLWGPPSLRSKGYRWSLPGGEAWHGRDADHSPHLGPRSRMSSSYYFSSSWRLHGGSGTALLYFNTCCYRWAAFRNTTIMGDLNVEIIITCIFIFGRSWNKWKRSTGERVT